MKNRKEIDDEIDDLLLQRALISKMEVDGRKILEKKEEFEKFKGLDNSVIEKISKKLSFNKFLKRAFPTLVAMCLVLVVTLSILPFDSFKPTEPVPTTTPTQTQRPQPTGIPGGGGGEIINFTSGNEYVVFVKSVKNGKYEGNLTENDLEFLDVEGISSYTYFENSENLLKFSNVEVSKETISTTYDIYVDGNIIENAIQHTIIRTATEFDESEYKKSSKFNAYYENREEDSIYFWKNKKGVLESLEIYNLPYEVFLNLEEVEIIKTLFP